MIYITVLIVQIEEKYGPKLLADVQIDTLSSDATFLAYFKDLYSPLIEIGRSQILVEWMRTLGGWLIQLYFF